MTKSIEIGVILAAFASTTLWARGAVVLAVIGGITGLVSMIVLFTKLNDFDELARNQHEAVTELSTRVGRIETVIEAKES